MAPLSGSQKALMQSRSGIARSGATRSGYFSTGNVVITIDNGGGAAAMSRHIVYNGREAARYLPLHRLQRLERELELERRGRHRDDRAPADLPVRAADAQPGQD